MREINRISNTGKALLKIEEELIHLERDCAALARQIVVKMDQQDRLRTLKKTIAQHPYLFDRL